MAGTMKSGRLADHARGRRDRSERLATGHAPSIAVHSPQEVINLETAPDQRLEARCAAVLARRLSSVVVILVIIRCACTTRVPTSRGLVGEAPARSTATRTHFHDRAVGLAPWCLGARHTPRKARSSMLLAPPYNLNAVRLRREGRHVGTVRSPLAAASLISPGRVRREHDTGAGVDEIARAGCVVAVPPRGSLRGRPATAAQGAGQRQVSAPADIRPSIQRSSQS